MESTPAVDARIGAFLGSFLGKDKTNLWLVLLLLFGLIIRIIAAVNMSVQADDMHFVTHAINFISSGKLVTYTQSSGLWFEFTDVMYHLLGATQLASRMAAVLFGTASILVIYLLTREFTTKRIALIAAFLLAMAPFHIKSSMAEMDVMAMFFILLSLFFFTRAARSEKFRYFALSGLALGLAIYTKVYPLLVIPSLLLYLVCVRKMDKKPIFSRGIIQKVVIFLAIIFFFCLPALVHNILLYMSRGFMDMQFTRSLGLGQDISVQYYGEDPIFGEKNDWHALIFGGENAHDSSGLPLMLVALGYAWQFDPFIVLIGIAGLILLATKKPKRQLFSPRYVLLVFLATLFLLPFLASIIHLVKHYLFLEVFLIPLGALALHEFAEFLTRFTKKNPLKIILLVYAIIVLFFLGLPLHGATAHVYGQGYVAQIMDFKENNIPETALIVADSRFYRGQINWMFQGRPYFEGNDFIQVLNQQDTLPGAKVATQVYYFECVPDDCGWGTVADQPLFNQSMEQLTFIFSNQTQLVKTITSPSTRKSYFPFISSENRIESVRIYSAKMSLNQAVVPLAKQPKQWFLYTIGYPAPEQEFDYYHPDFFSAKVFDLAAHLAARIALIIAFLSLLYVCWITFRDKQN